jgi:hypothetical protein
MVEVAMGVTLQYTNRAVRVALMDAARHVHEISGLGAMYSVFEEKWKCNCLYEFGYVSAIHFEDEADMTYFLLRWS